MKQNSILFLIFLTTVILGVQSCGNWPIDDDGLLITDKSSCYMSMFELLGPDNRTVLTGSAVIDTLNCTVTATAKFGTNIKHVKPYCSLVTDARLEPAMGEWVDFSQPRQYTVVSGNRQVRKTYTITVTVLGQ
jgi:hypothetical protein